MENIINRTHLSVEHVCNKCGKITRGPSYARHEKVCGNTAVSENISSIPVPILVSATGATETPVRVRRKRATKAEMECRRAGVEYKPEAKQEKSMVRRDIILVPRNIEDETASWNYVKKGDPRQLRELPEGAIGSLSYDLKIKGRDFCGLVRVGVQNEKTGSIQVYNYDHRLAADDGSEEDYSHLGAVFFWESIDINGEDVIRLQDAMEIGKKENK